MDIVNKDKSDFSLEVMVQLAICLEAVYAAEIICYRMADRLDHSNYINTLFQRRKQSFNKARKMLQEIIRNLEIAFDDTFSNITGKKDGNDIKRADFLHGTANDIVELLLIYFARGDGDQTKKDNMKKALMNFKPNLDIDLDAIMKFYDFKW